MFRPRKRKPSEKKQRSPEFYARQATRTVRSRTFWLMLVMGILLFVILFFQLYHLQITRHQEMQTRALDQQTRQTVVSAFRGTIYDRNGNELAVSATAETVFLSPKELAEELEKLGEDFWTQVGYLHIADPAGRRCLSQTTDADFRQYTQTAVRRAVNCRCIAVEADIEDILEEGPCCAQLLRMWIKETEVC